MSAIFSCISLSAQDSIRFDQFTYEQLLDQAKQEKKTVMIYFTGTGCSLCKKMEKQVFTVPAIAAFYNSNFINVESFDDFYKPDSATIKLRRQYGVISNPTFIFIDTDGNIIHKAGYKTKEEFLITGKQAVSGDNYRTWTRQFSEKKFETATVAKYLTAEQKPVLYMENGYQCRAQEVLDAYFASIPPEEYASSSNWDIISKYVANSRSSVFNYLLNNQQLFEQKYGKEAVNAKIYTVYSDAWSGNMSSEAFKTAERTLKTSTHPMARLRLQFAEMYDAISNMIKDEKANWNDFIVRYDSIISNYPYVINTYQVYMITKDICKKQPYNNKALTAANRWMKGILLIKENEDDDYLDAYAHTFSLLGKKKEAINIQQKAIDLAIAVNEDKTDIEAFKKTLEKYKNGQ